METFRKLCLLALFLTFVQNSNNAALSIYEQKKYKQFLEGQGLYTADDNVIVLTVNNFRSQVMNSPYAWLVEFYNSWCGFCQRFAPSWKALATDVKGWSDLVKVAALDCSVDENAPICREYEIMAYPTLRYFHEGYQAGPQKLGVAVQKGEDVVGHRHNFIKRLITEKIEGRGAQYPILLPYIHSSIEHLFDDAPSTVQYAFLITQRPDTFLGQEVTLDLHKTPSIIIRYTYSNNTDLITKYSLSNVPSIVVLDRTNNYQILNSLDTREDLRDTISHFLENKHVKVTDETPKQEIFTGKWLEADVPDMSAMIQERARQALKEKINKMGDVVFQIDLETALRYSLKHEIATQKLITGEKLQVLRAYLNVLRKYFPTGRGGHIFLAELAMKADTDEVAGSAIAEVIKRAEKEGSMVFSSPQQWLACRGSSPSYRGYPCGLWKLFHYLTVNSAERNSNDPLEILNVMHGYIKNFFGCHDCSQHFQDMARRREMRNVSSADSSVLWLWMAHNEVNKRLAGDQTEDPEFPKIQFPLKERCSRCRNFDGSWNLDEVLRYVKNVYNSNNVRFIGSDTAVLHLALDERPVTSGSSSIFKPLDMSMCFILYVCSFFLLALLIRIFLKRGYRKKPYVHDLLGKV